MIQAKQQTGGVAFFIPEPRKTTTKVSPKIVWEVPPPDFEIPDEPMDNCDQSLLAEALRDALSVAKRLLDNQFCATSVAVCAQVNGKTVTKAPDWLYVPYVHPTNQSRSSYTPYAEGQLPTIVMEFLSDKKRREYDNSPFYPYGKWYFYETILKVPWYVIFEPNKGKLEVYRLEAGSYKKQTADNKGRYWIDSMELFLGMRKSLHKNFNRETFWLHWWDATGNRLLWQYEQTKSAQIETRDALEKAEIEKQKAAKAEIEKQDALKKAAKAEIEKQDALKKAEIEKQDALKKAEIEKQDALDKAEIEKQDALDKAEIEKQKAAKIEKREALQIVARQLLQAQVEIAIIQQATGLDESEILLLNVDK
jgi:hypothetical protein